MSGRNDLLVLLTRYPRLGDAKMDLVPPLSPEEAVDLHDRLSRHALRTMLAVRATGQARCQVRTDASFPHANHDWLGGGFTTRYQGDGTLAERIRLAFGDAFGAGRHKVVVIGSDCPRLASDHLRDALRRLDGVDVVLGPTTGGGCYLIGLRKQSAKRSVPQLFNGIEWGAAETIDRVIEIAEQHDLSHVLLEPLPGLTGPADIADAEEVLAERALRAPGAGPDAPVRVSAIIPALDDADVIGTAVASALAGGADEVVVVDGGSRDATRDVALAAGGRVIDSQPGRARQLNAGAAVATGGILLFVHAHTMLPTGAARLARETLAGGRAVAGAFSFAAPPGARHAGPVSTLGRLRHRMGGVPFGAQGLFLPARTFRDLGGYPDMPAVEDVELCLRLRELGRVVVVRERAITSAHADDGLGVVVPLVVNQLSIWAYRLGIDAETIAARRRRISARARGHSGEGGGRP